MKLFVCWVCWYHFGSQCASVVAVILSRSKATLAVSNRSKEGSEGVVEQETGVLLV